MPSRPSRSPVRRLRRRIAHARAAPWTGVSPRINSSTWIVRLATTADRYATTTPRSPGKGPRVSRIDCHAPAFLCLSCSTVTSRLVSCLCDGPRVVAPRCARAVIPALSDHGQRDPSLRAPPRSATSPDTRDVGLPRFSPDSLTGGLHPLYLWQAECLDELRQCRQRIHPRMNQDHRVDVARHCPDYAEGDAGQR